MSAPPEKAAAGAAAAAFDIHSQYMKTTPSLIWSKSGEPASLASIQRLWYSNLHGQRVRGVPTHTQTRAVDEFFNAARFLPGAADLAVPGIPPAAGLRRPIRNIGVDEGVADRGVDIRGDRAFHEIEVHAHSRGESFQFTIDTGIDIREFRVDEGRLVIDVVPVDAEIHDQALTHAVAEGESHADVAIDCGGRTAIGMRCPANPGK